jgi:hypothetical protein
MNHCLQCGEPLDTAHTCASPRYIGTVARRVLDSRYEESSVDTSGLDEDEQALVRGLVNLLRERKGKN